MLHAEGFVAIVLSLLQAGPVAADLLDSKTISGLEVGVLLGSELGDNLVVAGLEGLILLGPERGQGQKIRNWGVQRDGSKASTYLGGFSLSRKALSSSMRTASSLEFLCSKSLPSRSLAFLSAHELSPEAPASDWK